MPASIRRIAPLRRAAMTAAATALLAAAAACSTGGSSTAPAANGHGPAASGYVRYGFAGGSDGTVSVFNIDAARGMPLYGSYAYLGGFTVTALAISPDYQFLYAATADGTVTTLSVDPASGALAAVKTATLPTGADPQDLELSADGGNAYVVNRGTETVSVFAVSPSSGGLTPVGTPAATGRVPVRMVLAPSGRFAYVLNQGSGDVSIYRRDASGLLTPTATTSLGGTPSAMVFNYAGTRAYVTFAAAGGNVAVFKVDTAGGGLAPAQIVTAGDHPAGIALGRAGDYAYVANGGGDSVSVFKMDGDGLLSAVQTVATAAAPTAVTVEGSGAYLYVTTGAGRDLEAFAIDGAAGTLTAVDEVRARADLGALALARSAAPYRVHAAFAIVPDQGLRVFAVDPASGALSRGLDTAAAGPYQTVMGPHNTFAYTVDNGAEAVTVHRFDPVNGAFTMAVQTVPVPAGWTDVNLVRLACDPSGRFLYLLDGRSVTGEAGRIAVYTVDAGNGTLTYQGQQATGLNPVDLVMHPSGRVLYTVDAQGGTVSVFAVNPATGGLTAQGAVTPGSATPGQALPAALALHPDGRYAYVTVENESSIVRYAVDTSGGLAGPAAVTTAVAAIGASPGPLDIALDPAGDALFVSHEGGQVSRWRLNPSTFAPVLAGAAALAGAHEGLAVDPNGQFVYVLTAGGVDRLIVSGSGAPAYQETSASGGTAAPQHRLPTIVTVSP